MPFITHSAALAAIIALAAATPAPQQLDFGAIDAAPTVPSGPSIIPDVYGVETASIVSSVTITGVATAQATTTGLAKRDTDYTPYYPALATGYTTDPAITMTATSSAPGSCVTQPEAGTYCGFINPEDPCSPQPDGYGPVPSPDTASAFLAYAPLHSMAQAAPTNVPSTGNTQYTQVFKDLNAAVSAQSYIGLYTLKTYDVPGCAAKCDAANLCTAFNIYAERDPSLNPSNNDSTAPTVWGYNCPNPASMTSFKCTLWGSNIDASMATNQGQPREQFQVVITASDGYDKTNVTTPPDCTAPSGPSSTSTSTITTTTSKATASTTSSAPTSPATSPAKPPKSPWGHPKSCGGKAINSGKHWMGSRFFPGPFNPQACSDYAILQNQANQKAGKGQCKMFNAYYLHKNNVPFGTYCSIFSTSLDPYYWATAPKTSYSGGDKYECKQSWIYSLK